MQNACAEGGPCLPIAHALCPLRSFGRPQIWKQEEGKKKERRKKKKKQKNDAKFSGHYVARSRTNFLYQGQIDVKWLKQVWWLFWGSLKKSWLRNGDDEPHRLQQENIPITLHHLKMSLFTLGLNFSKCKCLIVNLQKGSWKISFSVGWNI